MIELDIAKLSDTELADKATELIVIYLAQKSDAIDENPGKDKQNLRHLYDIIRENFQSDAEAAQSLADIEKIEYFKNNLAKRIKSDRSFAEKIRKLVENEPNKESNRESNKRRTLLPRPVLIAITLLAITGIGYFFISAMAYSLFPDPYQPEATHPIDNAKNIGLKESLSWIGGNPDIPVISAMLRLAQKNLGSRENSYKPTLL